MKKKLFKCLMALSMFVFSTAALAGCNETPKASISIATTSEVSSVERNDQVTIVPTVENGDIANVTYSVTGDATISSSGVLSVKTTAQVGSEIKVTASIDDVVSNELVFVVKDTLPTSMNLSASKAVIRENEQITFTANYTPAYATKTEFTIAVKEESKDIIEVCPTNSKAIQLKDGVDEIDYFGDPVYVVATLVDNPSVKAEKTIIIGAVEPFLSVDAKTIVIGRDSASDMNVNVTAFSGDGEPISIERSAFTFTSGDTSVFTIGEHTGVITPVANGSADVTVSFGDLDEKATVTVLVPPSNIATPDLSQTAINNGLATGFGATNKVHSPFVPTRQDSLVMSDDVEYLFELYDGQGQKQEVASSELGSVDENGDIEFKQTGKIKVTCKSITKVGEEKAPEEREAKTSLFFNVNEGTNVYDQVDLHYALKDPETKYVNLINKIEFKKINNIEDARGTYNSTYTDLSSNEKFIGYDSLGDKVINGNGYGITLAKLELPDQPNDGKDGQDFITFYSKDFNKDLVDQDVECTPFTVEIYDFYLIGNNDLQGQYKGDLGITAKMSDKNFYKTFRRGLRLGASNSQTNRYGVNLQRDYQRCANAYIDHPILKNVEIRGFETGLRMEHVVDGLVEGIICGDQYNNAIETNQCIVEIKNSTFSKVGGFCVEVVPDGINTNGNIQNVDWLEAGSGYDQLPDVKLTGTVNSENLTDGSDTDRMNSLKLGNYSITDILNIVINDMKTAVLTELLTGDNAADYAVLAQPAKQTEASAAIDTVVGQTFRNLANQKVNFFGLIFIYEYVKAGFPITGKDVANLHAETQGDGGEETNVITLHDLVTETAIAVAKGGSYTSFSKYNYIQVELDGATIRAAGECYLGQLLLVNNAYQA